MSRSGSPKDGPFDRHFLQTARGTLPPPLYFRIRDAVEAKRRHFAQKCPRANQKGLQIVLLLNTTRPPDSPSYLSNSSDIMKFEAAAIRTLKHPATKRLFSNPKLTQKVTIGEVMRDHLAIYNRTPLTSTPTVSTPSDTPESTPTSSGLFFIEGILGRLHRLHLVCTLRHVLPKCSIIGVRIGDLPGIPKDTFLIPVETVQGIHREVTQGAKRFAPWNVEDAGRLWAGCMQLIKESQSPSINR